MTHNRCTSIDQGIETDTQHRSPCGDCPWARNSLPGWLGGLTAAEFCDIARSDEPYGCHTMTNQQCAGMAVFRRNTCKLPRPPALVLPADHASVFSTHAEFSAHHEHKRGQK